MIVTALIIAALILALIVEFSARGRDLVAWAAVLVCMALLVGRL